MNAQWSLVTGSGRWRRWLVLAGVCAVASLQAQTNPRDYGDAPAPYPTLLQNNGAWHQTGGPFLGQRVDTELDGQPDANARGDDNHSPGNSNDEDGVIWITPLIPGQVAKVRVVVNGDFNRAFLSAWVDFNRNGSWSDRDDKIFGSVEVFRGTNQLEFLVPQNAGTGLTFSRFRITSINQSLNFTGSAENGEVEDHQVFLGDVQYDFGDAPAPYPTLLEMDGARHVIAGPHLGRYVDAETDGQPSAEAKEDDTTPANGDDDEDGVTFLTPLSPGRQAQLQVVVSGNGDRFFLNAWLDVGGDGSWAEPPDQILDDEVVQLGTNLVSFTVPENAKLGPTFARFRLSQERKLRYTGLASDGEVEDYRVSIVEPLDFGDAPAPYPTLLAEDGARHRVNRQIFLGYQVDEESDGQPTADADGDDTHPPMTGWDEDGVSFAGSLVQGRTATVYVNASTRGRLYAWVDFNRNGSWADPGERVFNGVMLTTGFNTLEFPVPADAVVGRTFTRWRFTVQGPDLSFVGEAPDGEVEDHPVEIITDRERCDLDTKGREFWLAFPGNYAPDADNPTRPTLYILGLPATTGTVSIAGLGFSTNYTIPASACATVALPTAADVANLNNAITNRGIRVTASGDVLVTAFNRARYTGDSYQALPASTLGTEYIVMAYGNLHSGVPLLNGSQFAVLGTQSNTVVTIKPTVTVANRAAGVPFSITLQPGDVFQLRATSDAPADLTGTVIEADKPVAVFTGHQCANVPTNTVWFCDYLVEQLLPVNTWGTEIYAAPVATRSGGDWLRILAAHDGTTVEVNGLPLGTLNRGQYLNQRMVAPAQITASQPVLVAQYATSSDYDDNPNADPFMVLLPAARHYLPFHFVTAPTNGFPTNYLQIIVPSFGTNSVTLDGLPVSPASFKPIYDGFYTVANIPVSPGPHLVNAGIQCSVMVYGWASYESYGHVGGYFLGDVLPPQVTPPTFNMTVNIDNYPNNPGTAPAPNIAGFTHVKDNCGEQTGATQDVPPATLMAPGQYKITVMAADYSGNLGKATVNFTVIDPSPVQIECPTNMTVTCNTNNGAVVHFNVLAYTTYQTNVTVVSTPPSGSVFPVGTTLVTNVATSLAGNTATCTFTVTVTCEKVVTASLGRTGLQLNWPVNGMLEYSVNPQGPWTVIVSNSNQYLSPMNGPRGFYRVRFPE